MNSSVPSAGKNEFAQVGTHAFTVEDYYRMGRYGLLDANSRVELVDSVVEVHRDPERGRYRSVQVVKPGDIIQPLAFPDISVAVGDILGEESRPEPSEAQVHGAGGVGVAADLGTQGVD